MKLTGAQLLTVMLEKNGIETIAGIPGGSNLPIYDALSTSGIQHVLCRHEQGAGFIAHGMARTTGETGVFLVTSGPGATNALTALADAKMDSVPLIMLSGQVPLPLIGSDAFQEFDTYGMTIPATKHNFLIRDAAEIPHIINEAFRISRSGRPGPVAVDIPKDVQKQIVEIDINALEACVYDQESSEFDPNKLSEISEAINSAKKPVLFIGGGAVNSGASTHIRELALKSTIPVVTTLMGIGAFPPDHPLFVGMVGMHGDYHTNHLMKEADLILALGVRFDDRATGKVSDFCPDARIIHVDIDESEFNKIKASWISLQADLSSFVPALLQQIEQKQRPQWVQTVIRLKEEYPIAEDKTEDLSNPEHIISLINRYAPEETIITTDVGQHQMWAARCLKINSPRSFHTSGGLGTMGFGLPAAIGAALAESDKKIICISGDGSLLMNIQELATLKDLELDVAIFLFNNQALGLVRQQQELFYNSNYHASSFESAPDFVKLAESFGLHAVDMIGKNDSALEEILTGKGPVLLNFTINEERNVFPIVPPGAANTELIGGKRYE